MKPAPVFLLLVLGAVPALAAPWQPFTALAASEDGRLVATGGAGGEVLCWELSTGEVLRAWQLGGLPVAGLVFGPEGGFLAAVQTDERAYLLNLKEPDPKSLVVSGSAWAALPAAAARWKRWGSPMSGTEAVREGVLAQGRSDGTVTVTGPSSGAVTWQAHDSAVTGLVWSPDGLVLITCSYDGSLARWDPRTGKLLSRL